ncbi:MAG: NUDIX domain-containing protein [bacterium]|nr:NUDIX domain-containing protein [bacterium]
MSKICDNKSVGQIIYKGNILLMIERKNFPKSYALPAGHLDGDTFDIAARRETKEEVGINIL